MTTNKLLGYYLCKAESGDGKAAFEAANLMRGRQMSEVLVQSQLRRSATLGYAPAQRALGILGICGTLMRPESTVAKVSFYESIDPAIDWLRKASANDDPVAKYALCKCMQYGLGLPKDEETAEALMADAVAALSMDTVVSIMYLFDSAVSSVKNGASNDLRTLLIAS